ncbi:hypothetical protein [Neisseria animaloris]|uniref:Uncharacterized protein n=1 Tax=Neisseria animaloris TaxID=326522 RepID=A0A3S4Y7K5_9NEIS|nr:hypothetical protein [Neisseria animaloris]VEJ21002.1 Uncharacterised protein [Neisseria animaloris]
MSQDKIDDFFKLIDETEILLDSYIFSYPYILEFFSTKFNSKNALDKHNFICGIHMIYGWMPHILELNPIDDLDNIITILNNTQKNKKISDEDLLKLAKPIDSSSVIGTSKLLHFIAPDSFAIWDNNVHKFICSKKLIDNNIYKKNIYPPKNKEYVQIPNYRAYLNLLTEIQKNSKFKDFHKSVNKKIGYEVSPLRAIELIMFLNSPNRTKK